MLASAHTQSLSDFRKSATATIDRVNQTGQAEIITVSGKARAVLLAPAVYDQMARELEIARDAAAIQKAVKQFQDGDWMPVEQAHQVLHDKLLAMKAARDAGQ